MAKTKKKKVEVAPLRASTEIVITESGCFERETIIKRVIPTEKLIQSLQGNVIISTPLLPTNEKGGCIQFEKCEGQHITFKFIDYQRMRTTKSGRRGLTKTLVSKVQQFQDEIKKRLSSGVRISHSEREEAYNIFESQLKRWAVATPKGGTPPNYHEIAIEALERMKPMLCDVKTNQADIHIPNILHEIKFSLPNECLVHHKINRVTINKGQLVTERIMLDNLYTNEGGKVCFDQALRIKDKQTIQEKCAACITSYYGSFGNADLFVRGGEKYFFFRLLMHVYPELRDDTRFNFSMANINSYPGLSEIISYAFIVDWVFWKRMEEFATKTAMPGWWRMITMPGGLFDPDMDTVFKDPKFIIKGK